jgi:tight adherence protein B
MMRMVFLSAVAVLFLSYFFYRSLWAVIPLSPVGVAFFWYLREKRRREKEKELELQFRECLLSLSTLMQAGHSAENAFLECLYEMEILFGDNGRICRELRQLKRGLCINIPLEELITDMGRRSGCEEILRFARVFGLAKRSGGNTAETLRSTAESIGRQIELRQELQSVLGAKRMELLIMRAMPFLVPLYIELTTPHYFDVLYHNPRGIGIMTGCLCAYLASYVMGERVLKRLEEEMV